MFKRLFDWINEASYFGVDQEDTNLQEFRKKVINRIFFITGITCLILVMEAIIFKNDHDNLIPLGVSFTSFASLALNYFKQFKLARFVCSVFFPTVFLLASILYGDDLKLDYTIPFFVVLVLTIYDDLWPKVFNIAYLIGLQIFSFNYTQRYPGIFAKYIGPYDNLIILTATTAALCILVFQFIRAHRNSNEQLMTLNQDLDRKNHALEESIKQKVVLNDQLIEKTNDLRRSSEFLESYTYIASHDLKTPLRSISGFSGLLNKKLKDTDDHEIIDYLNFIQTGVKQINAIIDGIIENAQNNRSNLNFEQVDCMEVLAEINTKIKFWLEESQGELVYDQLPEIQADRTMITKVFAHLIENGFKYNEEENPSVQVFCESKKDVFEFAVCDNGIGISDAYSEDIFKMFKKLHNSPQYTGSGVGLALCKKIVELHGGEIWMEKDVPKGSTFRFTIPKR